jgi:hypothetical protein
LPCGRRLYAKKDEAPTPKLLLLLPLPRRLRCCFCCRDATLEPATRAAAGDAGAAALTPLPPSTLLLPKKPSVAVSDCWFERPGGWRGESATSPAVLFQEGNADHHL